MVLGESDIGPLRWRIAIRDAPTDLSAAYVKIRIAYAEKLQPCYGPLDLRTV